MPIPSALAYALTFGVYGKYILIALAMPIGGPLLIFASGFLLRLHLVELVPIFIAIAGGELAMDIVWYYVGYSFTEDVIERYGKYVGITPDLFAKVQRLFARYRTMVLFVSKLIMGLGMGIALLIVAGSTRMHFGKYMFYNALGEVVWVSMVLFLGYFYAGLYVSVAGGLRWILVAATILVVGALMFGVSRYLRARALGRF